MSYANSLQNLLANKILQGYNERIYGQKIETQGFTEVSTQPPTPRSLHRNAHTEVARKYEVPQGIVQNVAQTCHGFVACMVKFCKRINWGALAAALDHYSID